MPNLNEKVLTVYASESTMKVVTKFVEKSAKALKSILGDMERTKIHAEMVVKLHAIKMKDKQVTQFEDFLNRLSGLDPIDEAKDFLKKYDENVALLKTEIEELEHFLVISKEEKF